MSDRLKRPAPGWPIACAEQAEAPHCEQAVTVPCDQYFNAWYYRSRFLLLDKSRHLFIVGRQLLLCSKEGVLLASRT